MSLSVRNILRPANESLYGHLNSKNKRVEVVFIEEIERAEIRLKLLR